MGVYRIEVYNRGDPLQKYSIGLPWNINGPVPMEDPWSVP